MSSHDYSPLLSLSEGVHQINEWMCHNILQLNADKTEVIVFGPNNERSKIGPHLNSMLLTDKARNLGVIIGSDLNFNNNRNHNRKIFIAKYHFTHTRNLFGEVGA